YVSAGIELAGRARSLDGDAAGPSAAAPATPAARRGIDLQLSVRRAALAAGTGNPGAVWEALRFAVGGVCASSRRAVGQWRRPSGGAARGGGGGCPADRRRRGIRRRGGRADLRAGSEHLRRPGR